MTEAGRKFLEKKWRHFAYTMDHDKDGNVSREDHLDFANRAIEMGGIDPNSLQAVQIRRKLLQTFEDLYGKINNGNPVSYDDIVRSFSQNQDELRRLQAQDYMLSFDMIDTSGDGFIQREEFRRWFYMIHQSAEDADKVFDWIDLDKDGKLDLKEYMIFGEKFFLSTDETHPSKNMFGILSEDRS